MSIYMLSLRILTGTAYTQVPSNLTAPDKLHFNVTLLFPLPKGDLPLYINNFLTSLPYFTQNITASPPLVNFGNVALGSYKASLHIDVSTNLITDR